MDQCHLNGSINVISIFDMKRLFLLFSIIAFALPSHAQSWDQVKNDTQNYLTGEGFGETLDEADQQALQGLISKLTVAVSSSIEILEGESRTGDSEDYKRYVENKISTYSNATLTNTEQLILSNEPDAHVVRWIKRSEIERIFAGRKAKVFEYISNAERGEQKGKVDDALRNYYWAFTLLKTLQHPSEVKYNDHTLVTWLPEKINEIFESISISVCARQGENLELFITFNDKPVTSMDYTYFDGGRWSNIYSAKDGKGVLELAPGAVGENLQLKVEFAYKNEAHIDREIASVINVVKGAAFRKSNFYIKGKVDQASAMSATSLEQTTNAAAVSTLTRLDDETAVRADVDRVVEAIRSKTYGTVSDLFTPDGWVMYDRLISYGKAQIIGTPEYQIYRNGDRVVVRSIPMSFHFDSGIKKSFVEDIVLTFDSTGKIDILAFALDDVATKDVLNQKAWPEMARAAIIEFLENYKTAFALERLDYIRTIFDDNAVIIVGKVATVAPSPASENQLMLNNKVITRTRVSKEQYLKNLERCFDSNEYVNIRFANNEIIKAGKGGETYGIQIKQDYYSTNYGDTGYLFLLVDINDPQAPMIKVRTWQPEPDPIEGLYNIAHF